MQEQFSKYNPNAFKQIGINAAMLLSEFDPTDGSYDEDDIIGVTTGGVNFQASYEYTDYGEDMDNVPKNTKELKRVDDVTATCSGTFVTITPELAERLNSAADNTNGHIVPRTVLDLAKDFRDIWIVGDYSDKNTGSGAGFIAIHLMNALSTGGFQIQTEDKGKMQFAFEFTGHFSMDNQDEVPYEIYIKGGSAAPGISLDKSRLTVEVGSTAKLNAAVYPANATITWASNDTDKASVSGGVVTGVAAGYAVITASISTGSPSVTYTDICTVQVVPASA